jgi:hypothetical protein
MPLLPFLVLAAVILLLAFGIWRMRTRTAAGDIRGPKIGLLKAADEVLKTAQRERMPLLKGLEHAGEDPSEWFACSIAGVVPVCRRNADGYEVCCWGDCDPQSLYIRQRDVRTYLRWARSVQ